VPISLRGGFYGGLAVAVCVGLFLLWLWRPGVRSSATPKLHAIEHKDWTAAGNFIAGDYHDQWDDDRPRVLERMLSFQYVRGLRITHST
jgi:hypothetical protein